MSEYRFINGDYGLLINPLHLQSIRTVDNAAGFHICLQLSSSVETITFTTAEERAKRMGIIIAELEGG